MKKTQKKILRSNSDYVVAKAFSLIEMAIVLLIIGALIIGILGGKRLLQKSALSNAETLTQNSGVAEIEGLAAWYETSLEDSFNHSEGENNTAISAWYNRNLKSETRNDGAQTTSANQPKFYEKVFNKTLPAIRFDGTNDFLTLEATALLNTSYTIFVVAQRNSSDATMPFLGSVGSVLNENLFLGYSSNTAIGYSQHQHNDGITFTIGGYSAPTATIHTFMLNNVAGLRYWQNGAASVSASDGSKTTNLAALSGLAIGRYSQNDGSSYGYFNGDIAEIIIFKRALRTEEKKAVEFYLGKKYAIVVGE